MEEAPLADPSWESENVEPLLGGGGRDICLSKRSLK
jgi:hypothetical protein